MDTLNTSVLGELQSFMDADEFMEFIDSAHQKLQQQAPVLLACIAEQHWDEARRLAHRLKGMLGSLGCDSLYVALHSLEEGLRQTPPRTPQAQEMAQLDATLQAAQQALKRQCVLVRSAAECKSPAAAAPSPRAHGLVPQPGKGSHKAG